MFRQERQTALAPEAVWSIEGFEIHHILHLGLIENAHAAATAAHATGAGGIHLLARGGPIDGARHFGQPYLER